MLFVFVLFPLFVLSLAVSGIVILVSGKGKRRAAMRTILLMYLVGFGLALLAVITLVTITWVESPMQVDRADVIGTYRVDPTMFAGPQADWQHESFILIISEEDTVTLRSRDIKGRWHEFKRPIQPVSDVHSYLWQFPTEGDLSQHHVLWRTPVLYREKWGFYYAFHSPRFGYMFFRKED